MTVMHRLHRKNFIKFRFSTVIVFFLFICLNGCDRSGNQKSFETSLPKLSGASIVPDVPKSLFVKLDEMSRDVPVVRDPFSKPIDVVQTEVKKKMILTGIIWDQNQPAAIINDVLVTVGGTVDGRTITAIDKDRVVVEEDGEEQELFVGF